MRGEVLCYGEICPEGLSAAHVANQIARYEAVGCFTEICLLFRSGGGLVPEAEQILVEIMAAQERGLQLTAVIESEASSAAMLVAFGCGRVIANEESSILLHRSEPSDGWENWSGDDLAAMKKKCARIDATVADLCSVMSKLRGKEHSAAYFASLMNGSVRLSADRLLELGLVDEVADELSGDN